MTSDNKEILVIAIGGTIDSEKRTWEMPTGPKEVTMLEESEVVKLVDRIAANPNDFGFSAENFPKLTAIQYKKFVDSSKFTKDDQEELAEYIKKCGVKNIIITTGTDFMIPLSKNLKEALKDEKDLLVQVTGAMTPLKNLYEIRPEWGATADGFKNVPFAIYNAKENELAPGFYVTFHGKVRKPDNLGKDYNKGTFVEFCEQTSFTGAKGTGLGKLDNETSAVHCEPIKFEGARPATKKETLIS